MLPLFSMQAPQLHVEEEKLSGALDLGLHHTRLVGFVFCFDFVEDVVVAVVCATNVRGAVGAVEPLGIQLPSSLEPEEPSDSLRNDGDDA